MKVSEAVETVRPPTRATSLGTWIGWVSFGELAGFCAPAAAGALLAESRPAVLVPVLVSAGVIEGTVLGLSQAHVLSWAAQVSQRGWVLATAAAAGVAWLLGLAPSATAGVWDDWPVWTVAAAGVVLGAGILLTLGLAQWLVLRRQVPDSAGWIRVTALAWALGLLAFTAITSPLWQPGQAVWLVVLIGAGGGAAMAVSMTTVTGLWLRRRGIL